MHEPGDTGGLAGLGNIARALDVGGIEAAPGRFEQQADQVDGGIRPLQGGGHVGGFGDVAADRLDLAHVAQDAQVLRQMRLPHRHPHAPALPRQGADGLCPDEAGPAEDGDQTGREFGHGERS